MKATKSLLLGLALLVSAPAAAIDMQKLVKMGGVCLLGLCLADYATKKQATKDEVASRRSPMDEQSPAVMATRVVRENVFGQRGNEQCPTTGLVGHMHCMAEKMVMPFACSLMALDRARGKLVKGLRYLDLNGVAEQILPMVPNLNPEEKKQA